MKRWQAILIQLGLTFAGWATSNYVPKGTLQDSAFTAIAVVAGTVAKKTSDANPNGTSAKIPYVPEVK